MPADPALVSEIRRNLGPGLKIVILAEEGAEFEELANQVALQLQRAFHRAVFITGGLPGVQETFATSCHPSKVYKLTPGTSIFNGITINAGRTLKEVQNVLACIGDVYIAFAGEHDVSEQASIAFSRGAAVIPIISTGGASSGQFDFPVAILKKPAFVSKEHWSCISGKDSSEVATAAAITAIVAGYSRGQPRSGEASSSITRREQERMERIAAAMVSWQGPPWLTPYMEKLGPALEVSGHVISVVGPPVYGFYAGLYKGYKALPREAATCLWGIGQCFFGGTYAAFFAAAEAFKTSGGDQVLVSFQDLHEDALAVLDANFQQEKELGHSATLSDKVKLVLRTVDPERISVAVGCIWAGCMGIVMALKSKFARTVAFAHSIGDNLRPLAAKVLAPSALAVTPPEYRQWVEPTINVGCKVVATMVAWKLQRTISSVQSGIAGGMIASRSACSYILPILKNRNLVPDLTEDSLLDELLGWGLAATGIYFQVFCEATPPLIFLPVTLPIGIAESWLKWSVTWLGND